MLPNETVLQSSRRPSQARWLAAHLVDAMETERRLLDELGRLMRQQRVAIAADDHASLDDATFGIQRVLQTLTESSRRSHMIARFGGAERRPLAELVDSLGLPPSEQLLAAQNGLREATRLVKDEVRTNRAMLGEALAKQP